MHPSINMKKVGVGLAYTWDGWVIANRVNKLGELG